MLSPLRTILHHSGLHLILLLLLFLSLNNTFLEERVITLGEKGGILLRGLQHERNMVVNCDYITTVKKWN